MSMNVLFLYILPAILIVGVFFLGTFRAWVERCAIASGRQLEAVESYQKNAAKFIRLADVEKHSEIVDVVRFAGDTMLDGSSLIKAFISVDYSGVTDEAVDNSAFESLPEPAKHAFGKALAMAVIASSYQSLVFGDVYRNMLILALDGSKKEVKRPVQVVHSFRKSSHLSAKNGIAA